MESQHKNNISTFEPWRGSKAVVSKNTKYGLTCKKSSSSFFKFTFPPPASRKNFMQETKNDAHITEFDKISTQIGGDSYKKKFRFKLFMAVKFR